MAGVDQFDQRLCSDMGVDLRRGDIGVAEQGLQGAQISAAFEQVGSEGVAQDVRRDALGRDAGVCRQFLAEFGTDLVVAFRQQGELVSRPLSDLLPSAFVSTSLV